MSGVRTVHDGLTEYLAWATDPRPRIPWGLPFFDGPTGGGLARSETAMIIAYSSVGKTSILLNIVRNNPTIPTLFFSLEMSWRQVVSRLTAMEFGISTQSIEADLKEHGYNRFHDHMADRFSRFVCDDTPAISLKQAKESYRHATELLGEPPRLVVWDYLERVGGMGLMGGSERITQSTIKMADWHRDLDCSGVLLHQVGKGSDTGGYLPLSLDDGKYGGHESMDYVVGAYAPRLNPELSEFEVMSCESDLYMQLLKSRSGAAYPAGKRYRRDPVSMRIGPWTEPHPIVQSWQSQMAAS
jgi:hypothetical protein